MRTAEAMPSLGTFNQLNWPEVRNIGILILKDRPLEKIKRYAMLHARGESDKAGILSLQAFALLTC